MSASGGEAFVGGPGDDGRTGAVWAFAREGGEWSAQGGKLSPATPLRAPKPAVRWRSRALAGARSPAHRARWAKAPSTPSCAKARTGAKGPRWRRPPPNRSSTARCIRRSFERRDHRPGGCAERTTVEPLEVREETEERGVAWTFEWDGTAWSEHEELDAANGGEDVDFGEYVGLSADGSTALVPNRAGATPRSSAMSRTAGGNAARACSEKLLLGFPVTARWRSPVRRKARAARPPTNSPSARSSRRAAAHRK